MSSITPTNSAVESLAQTSAAAQTQQVQQSQQTPQTDNNGDQDGDTGAGESRALNIVA